MSEIKNVHFPAIKRALQLLPLLYTLVSALILMAPTCTTAAPITAPLVPCDKQEIIHLPLSENWERVSTVHPQALCVFRSKNVGFPTLTVVQSTPPLPAEVHSEQAKMDYLEKSYHLVGINDARASDLADLKPFNLRGYCATMSFTTSLGATKALVAVYELPDRNYILTLQDRAESFERTKDALYTITRGVRIVGMDGDSQPIPNPPKADWIGWILIALIGVALFVGTSLWITRGQRT